MLTIDENDLIQGHKVSEAFVLLERRVGKSYVSSSSSGLQCLLCLGLSAFFWHQQLYSEPDGFSLFSWISLTHSLVGSP